MELQRLRKSPVAYSEKVWFPCPPCEDRWSELNRLIVEKSLVPTCRSGVSESDFIRQHRMPPEAGVMGASGPESNGLWTGAEPVKAVRSRCCNQAGLC